MRRLLASATLLFGILVLAGCNLADLTILWPPGDPPPKQSIAERRNISGVEVWIAHPQSNQAPEARVLRFYGNAARADYSVASDAMLFPSFEIWAVNYPGYGGSAGRATLRGVANAALAVFDAMPKDNVPILVAGTSLGTTAALHVAAERSGSVHGVILENPPPLKKLVMGEYGWWNLWWLASYTAIQVPDALDSEWNASRCTMPALIVSAERDEIVPRAYQKRVMDAYAGPKNVIVVPNATHNSALPPEAVLAVIRGVNAMVPAKTTAARSSKDGP